ncbi:MAG TPA: sigma-70 family RNA polymerase sigma factor [Algoriphagus sp.]|nr:sigma-70 family RNA polymerase sigma factor [Algoriphagus sp.]
MPEKKISSTPHEKRGFQSSASPPFSSDGEAWDAFRQGNESAFIFIYETYFEILFGYGFSIVPDPNIVKDSLQDLFIQLRERRGQLGSTDSIKFYLFKCLKRRLQKEISKWPGIKDSLDAIPADFLFTLSYEAQLIDKQLTTEKITHLNEAITKLSKRQREIIYYSFFEGFNYTQIQEIMGLESHQSGRNLMYKALKELRKLL